MKSSVYFCLIDFHLDVTGVRCGRVVTSRPDMNETETHVIDWSKYLVLFAYRETDGSLESPLAASFIAINLNVLAKAEKAGTDFTTRPIWIYLRNGEGGV